MKKMGSFKNSKKTSFSNVTRSNRVKNFNKYSLFKKILNDTKLAVGRGLQKKEKKNPYVLILKRLLIAGSFVFLVGILIGCIVVAVWMSNLTKSLAAVNIDQSVASVDNGGDTIIFDKDGTALTRYSGDQTKDYITIDQVPDFVKAAFVAAENKTFYQDKGVDLFSLARAGFKSVTDKNSLQGGSTITQQVVKNVILKDQRQNADRKMRELILSVQLAQKYSKDQILQFYINSISFGSNVLGIKRASEKYFSKEPKDLTYAEAALLAGIPNDPNRLAPPGFTSQGVDPYNYKSDGTKTLANLDREKDILARMDEIADTLNALPNENFHIDKQKIKDGGNETIAYHIQQIDSNAPHFTAQNGIVYNEVKSILKTLPDYKDKSDLEIDGIIKGGGLRIYTTLDSSLQQRAQDSIAQIDNEKTPIPSSVCSYCLSGFGATTDTPWNVFGARNAAMISVNSKTGAIISYAGSKNYTEQRSDGTSDGQVDILANPVSMGSSMKPANYLTGFINNGLAPSTVWANIPLDFGGGYRPANFTLGDKELVAMSTYDALNNSENRPAVQSIYTDSTDKYAELTGKLGYTPSEVQKVKDVGLSATLGAAYITPHSHAQLYQTLANGGVRQDLYTVERISDRSGKDIYKKTIGAGVRVVDEKYDWLLYDTLRGYPTVQNIRKSGFDCAGKTGTNDAGTAPGKKGYPTSVVFWGFCPGIVTGVMALNSNNTELRQYAVGEKLGQFLWTPYMQNALTKINDKTVVARPAGIVQRDICQDTGFLLNPQQPCDGTMPIIGYPYSKNIKGVGYFVDGKFPQLDNNHLKLRVVDCNGSTKLASKSDELAGLAKDQYFVKYQTPTGSNFILQQINDYANSHGQSPPPTDTCNVPRTADGSVFTKITSPADSTLYNPGDTVPISVDAAGNVTDAKFYFDNNLIFDATAAPFSAQYTLPAGIAGGVHIIKVVVTADNNTTGQASVNIHIKGNLDNIGVQINNPVNRSSQPAGNVVINTSITDPNSAIKAVKLYAKKHSDTSYTVISSGAPSGKSYDYTWNMTTSTPGQYDIYAEVSDGVSTKNSNVVTFTYL